MTYNFDPDRWYDNERKALDAKRNNGDIGANEFQAQHEALQRRYEEMLDRLDGLHQFTEGRNTDGPTALAGIYRRRPLVGGVC